MSLVEATALASLAGGLGCTPWSQTELLETAREAPHLRFSRNNEVVQADAALNQAFWRIFALLDPLSVPPSRRNFAVYYSKIKSRLAEEFNISSLDAAEPSKALATYLHTEMRRLDAEKRRPSISLRIKLELLDLCGEEAYCWTQIQSIRANIIPRRFPRWQYSRLATLLRFHRAKRHAVK